MTIKHNNVIESPHFRKWWQRYVKTWLNQAGRKKSRRLARQNKIGKLAPRPIGLLRPVVHPPTQRYNSKLRFGRGFTLEELKAAGVSRKAALSIGIAVDHRRVNRCNESLNLNTQRLKNYLSKLVVFPRRSTAKHGNGGIPDDTLKSAPVASTVKSVITDMAMPVPRVSTEVEIRKITDEEKQFCAYQTLRRAWKEARNVGKQKKDKDVAM